MKRMRPTPNRKADPNWAAQKPDLPVQPSQRAGTNPTPPGTADHPPEPQDKPEVVTRFSVLATHVGWFLAGPIGMILALWGLLHSEHTGIGRLDLLFVSLAAMTLSCRWLEQRSGQATTSEGRPATEDDFRSYARVFPIVAAAAWLSIKATRIVLN